MFGGGRVSPGTKTRALLRGNRLDYLKYILLFVLIQLINIPLTIIGIPLVAAILALEGKGLGLSVWPNWAWLWFNDEDGFGPKKGFLNEFVWLALRNPVANLRHVRGVSGVGRPLFYRTWLSFNKQFYVKAGWMSNGFPALSAGAGKGF